MSIISDSLLVAANEAQGLLGDVFTIYGDISGTEYHGVFNERAEKVTQQDVGYMVVNSTTCVCLQSQFSTAPTVEMKIVKDGETFIIESVTKGFIHYTLSLIKITI